MLEFTRDGASGDPKAIVWTENEKKNRVPKSPPFFSSMSQTFATSWTRSAVGNMSGYRCVSDCRPRGPARFHTIVEIDNEIISTVILLPSADSFKKGCCQLQVKVCARITG